MIEFTVNRTDDAGTIQPLAQVRIRREDYLTENESAARYSVQVAVDRGGEVGFYQRQIVVFPRNGFNVLSLIQAALDTLENEELELADDGCLQSDMAWGFDRALLEIQAKHR